MVFRLNFQISLYSRLFLGFYISIRNKQDMDIEIAGFPNRGIIEPSFHEPLETISIIFPRRKKSGENPDYLQFQRC